MTPILHNDDWCRIIEWLNSPLLSPSPIVGDRPLQWILPWMVNRVLPIHLTIYVIYFFQVGALFISAYLIFELINRLLVDWNWFAFLVAALYLVFPADYTNLYITMIGIKIGAALTFLAMILFHEYIKSGKNILLVVLILAFILGLLMFEAQLGLLVVWPVILFFKYRHSLTRPKIIGTAMYYLSISGYLIWKVYIQSTGFIEKKQGYLEIGFSDLAKRYFSTLRIFLGGFQLNIWDSAWITGKNFLLVLAIVLLLIVIAKLILCFECLELSPSRLDKSLWDNAYIFVLGVALAVAGYFPIILNYPPNIYGVLSRVNMFSTPGIILVLLSIKFSIGFGIFGNLRLAKASTIWAALVLIGWGSIIHVYVQDVYIQSWGETKEFYQQLFTKVPDLVEDTQVAIVLDGYDGDGMKYRPLFSSSWEPGCAFRALYNDDGIRVFYRYNEITVPSFPAMNILTNTMFSDTIPEISKLDDLVVLSYDKSSNLLEIEENIRGVFVLESNSNYSPYDRILPLEKEIIARQLVDN